MLGASLAIRWELQVPGVAGLTVSLRQAAVRVTCSSPELIEHAILIVQRTLSTWVPHALLVCTQGTMLYEACSARAGPSARTDPMRRLQVL